MAGAALPRSFFLLSPLEVAPALLGMEIVRRAGGRERRARIVETEAYLGLDDPAAHAFHGLTARTAILYGEPGRAYIYLIYGLHLCLNVSTMPAGTPGGVLFRAAYEEGSDPAALRGPGRLTHGLGITMPLNGCDLTRPGSLFLARPQLRRSRSASAAAPETIAAGPRIGIRHARDLPYRFFLENHHAVSRPRGPVLARQPLQRQ